MATEENKELFTKVKQIISEQLGVDEDEVTTTASFVDDWAPIPLIRWNW